MSDASQGAGWWQASDGKWYPPDQHPDHVPPTTGWAPPQAAGETTTSKLKGVASKAAAGAAEAAKAAAGKAAEVRESRAAAQPDPPTGATPPASSSPRIYKVRESGKNGTVEIHPKMIVRTISKVVGRDDREMIPMGAISSAKHNRKTVGTDIVTLHTSGKVFEWKVAKSDQAAQMVAEIMSHIVAS